MNGHIKNIIEYGLIIVLVIVIRIYLITPIQVNGRSMESTLYNGDIMMLNIVGYHTAGLKRFDIVVIKYQDEHIIKRVIGLPGERIEYKDNKLFVNGKTVKDVVTAETTDFSTYDLTENGVIPDGKYFVLGDNRTNSTDSRIIGLIDQKDIMGKTNLILFPFNHFGMAK